MECAYRWNGLTFGGVEDAPEVAIGDVLETLGPSEMFGHEAPCGTVVRIPFK